jgi:hypothetical protein
MISYYSSFKLFFNSSARVPNLTAVVVISSIEAVSYSVDVFISCIVK